jgi:hypothetical protein
MITAVLGARFLSCNHHHFVQVQRPPPTLGETLLESCSQFGVLMDLTRRRQTLLTGCASTIMATMNHSVKDTTDPRV